MKADAATAAARPFRRRLLIAAVSAAWLLLAFAPQGTPQPMRFERLSIEEGLSQSVVNCILQDSTGFLWLGTQAGLNRYDGYGFAIYRPESDHPGAVAHDYIVALAEGPGGDLWIATEGGGLSRWRRATDTFVNYRHDPDDPRSLSSDVLAHLAWGPDGSLWVATRDDGLNRFESPAGSAPGQGGTFRRFRHRPSDPHSLSDDHLRTVYPDRSGKLWVGTWGGGLSLFDRQRQSFVHFRHDPDDPRSLNDDHVRAITEDRHGGLWIGTETGLNRFDRESGEFERFLHDPEVPGSLSPGWVRALFEDRDGRLWIGTDGGLNLWREETRSFIGYQANANDPFSLGNSAVVSLFQDRSGLLWVGTLGGGASKWNPGTWAVSQYLSGGGESGAGSTVFAISQDEDGRVWIGTFGGGLTRIERDPATGVARRHVRYLADPADEHSLGDDRVTALLHDRSGTLWVGTFGAGLNRFDPTTERFERYLHDPERPDSLSTEGVTALHLDRHGRLWVATLDGGLHLHRGGGSFRRFRHHPDDPASLSHDRLFSIAEDGEGRLWLATDGGGLNRFDPAGEHFLRLRHDPQNDRSLTSDELYAVHVDDAGQVWVGTKSYGLDRLESLDEASGQAQFRNYSRSEGLPDGTIWAILSEAGGAVWLSTNRGLARLDPVTETFKNYEAVHGLSANEFNLGACHRGAGGELFFGGYNGVSAFHPDRLIENHTVPPVILTDFTRFNETVAFDRSVFAVDEILLSFDDRFLAFEFAALDFTAPEKNHYRYQLQGFDDAWVDLGARRRVDLTDFEPGDYVLRVQGSNNDGAWNQDGLAVRIKVQPPFWATWWFRLAALAAAAAAVGLGYEVKTRSVRRNARHLQALVEERTGELEAAQKQLLKNERLTVLGELAGGVAHEIRNPLSTIRTALYLLRRQGRLADEVALGQLTIVEQQIQRTERIVSELLDYARGPTTHFERFPLQEVATQALAAIEIADAIRVESRFGAGRPLMIEADADQVRRILINLLTNAVQAMPDGGELRVECEGLDGEMVVAVTDTGEGITEEDLPRIFEPLFTTKANGIGLGLSLSQRYAALNRGRIECDSLAGRGTSFRLVLPAVDGEAADRGSTERTL